MTEFVGVCVGVVVWVGDTVGVSNVLLTAGGQTPAAGVEVGVGVGLCV